MGLMDLLKESQERAPKRRSSEDDGPRLHFIDMSRKGYTTSDGTVVPSNQGTIKFIPIAALNDKHVKYAYDVECYNYEGEERNSMYRVMDPVDYEMKLTDDQKALITSIRSLVGHFEEVVGGFPNVDHKSYALMFGYILDHQSVDGEVITDKESRKTAILIFPSKNFAKAMTACLRKLNDYGEEIGEEMYADLFSRNTERENYLTINFWRSEGFGYDVDISADAFDRKSVKILTPEELKAEKVSIPQEEIDRCTYHTAIFFANNYEDDKDFDENYAEAVKAQMTKIINDCENAASASEKLPPLPNKNKKKASDLDE